MNGSNQRLQRLTPQVLPANVQHDIQKLRESPVTALQIGEGNFLRGFFDWMVHESRKQGLYDGSVAVTQPRPSGADKLRQLQDQGGLFTLIVRGLEEGQSVEHSDVVCVFSQVVDPYEQWVQFLAIAEAPMLQVVVSNTTEAGLTYQAMAFDTTVCPTSFPARLTLFLYHRFCHFDGNPDKGLICLPCELVDGNGDRLREYVHKYSEDWCLPDSFKAWLRDNNQFLNSLVDRIVTGFPTQEADVWSHKLGYQDTLLNTAEPYHLWAIQADEELAKVLPFREAGLNVHFVKDLAPYQIRKVRILNGLHTMMAPLGLLRGLQHVRQVVEDPGLGPFLEHVVSNEIIPGLPLDTDEMRTYAKTVWDRFCNPFIDHRLSDIAMNSVSKFRVRVLPSLFTCLEQTGELPHGILQSWAALLRLYKVDKSDAGYEATTWAGDKLLLRDDVTLLEAFCQGWSAFERKEIALIDLVWTLLANAELWGRDLTVVDELAERLCEHLNGALGPITDSRGGMRE